MTVWHNNKAQEAEVVSLSLVIAVARYEGTVEKISHSADMNAMVVHPGFHIPHPGAFEVKR